MLLRLSLQAKGDENCGDVQQSHPDVVHLRVTVDLRSEEPRYGEIFSLIPELPEDSASLIRIHRNHGEVYYKPGYESDKMAAQCKEEYKFGVEVC